MGLPKKGRTFKLKKSQCTLIKTPTAEAREVAAEAGALPAQQHEEAGALLRAATAVPTTEVAGAAAAAAVGPAAAGNATHSGGGPAATSEAVAVRAGKFVRLSEFFTKSGVGDD